MNRKHSFWWMISVLGLISCTIGPDYKRSPISAPQKWSGVVEEGFKEKTAIDWWAHFNDEKLTSLIQQVMRQNFDLKAAEQALVQSQALLRKSEADLWPSLTALGAFSVNKSANNYTDTITGQPKYHLYTAQVGVNWEIDLFGRLKRLKEVAQANLQAQMEDCYGVFLSLVAQTVETYVRLRSAQQQLILVEDLMAKAERIYQLMRDKYASGLVDQRMIDGAERRWSGYKAQAQPLRAAIENYIHGLSLLTSQAPRALKDYLQEPAQIPSMPPEIFVGVPAQMVERRPDIRKAEMTLASATAQIGVAKSQWFPTFSLVGSQVGYESTESKNFISPNSIFYSAGPTVTWNIFDFGQVKAQVLASEAARNHMYSTYMQTVLKALEEVESGLTAYAHALKRSKDVLLMRAAAKNTVALTRHRYDAGLDSAIEWLEAELTSLEVALEEIIQQETVALDVVTLYKALGGGWEYYVANHRTDNTL